MELFDDLQTSQALPLRVAPLTKLAATPRWTVNRNHSLSQLTSLSPNGNIIRTMVLFSREAPIPYA
jgi:hypothetical protein